MRAVTSSARAVPAPRSNPAARIRTSGAWRSMARLDSTRLARQRDLVGIVSHLHGRQAAAAQQVYGLHGASGGLDGEEGVLDVVEGEVRGWSPDPQRAHREEGDGVEDLQPFPVAAPDVDEVAPLAHRQRAGTQAHVDALQRLEVGQGEDP